MSQKALAFKDGSEAVKVKKKEIKKKIFRPVSFLPLEKIIYPLITLLAFTGIWHGLSTMYPTYQLPSPLDVCRGMMELWGEGVIWEHIRVSLFRFSVAYFLAAASGIFLGLLFGWHIRLHAAFDPFVQMLRPISPIAWFPLAILWFKVGDPPAIFIIYLAAFFPILLTTIAAVRSVEHIYLQVALNFGTRERDILTKIIIPAAFPQIMVGLHLALGSAWIHLVAGEMLGAQSGLGFLIIDARNFLRTDWIISGMIFIGLLGLALDKCMGWMEKRINLLWGHVMKN